ncbi:hypothetical protein [Streptomyces tagetis]|uniref:Secreted protein n=1 Tax=Streptomyces tagetis TaxID=2820809 RepID=A0A941AX12_9ACTN|nr:hypothetical protein [Streptomyces sp. RG38]MBQ0825519.1 hypothetical protein [Streptomyces sp. RG38]
MRARASFVPAVTSAGALALLPLPGLSTGRLTAGQIRGAECVWCATVLTIETAVDLGTRSGTFAGAVTAWYPRGCPDCVREAALAVYTSHPSTCEQCVDDPALCTIRSALRALVLTRPHR